MQKLSPEFNFLRTVHLNPVRLSKEKYSTSQIKQALCSVVYFSLKNFVDIQKVEGVNFVIGGAKISIDTACMGLSMFKTGLLLGAILLTLEEKKHQKTYRMGQILVFAVLVVFFNILSNYFRIVTLILLDCTEENLLHYSVGIFCFVLYQLVPMAFLINQFQPEKQESIHKSTRISPWVISVCLSIVAFISLNTKFGNQSAPLQIENLTYNHKNGTWVNPEVYKIETAGKLVYLKTPTHKPLVCWTGNGYKITQSKCITQGKDKIWFNLMEKQGVVYQSLWWYEFQGRKYTSFLGVMALKLISNKPIVLINEVRVIK
ncbi:MAG: exosortase N [Flavobacteriaceae bacterium]|nr:MAG: exosortase N [Flavobacteriaceae bacterium]